MAAGVLAQKALFVVCTGKVTPPNEKQSVSRVKVIDMEGRSGCLKLPAGVDTAQEGILVGIIEPFVALTGEEHYPVIVCNDKVKLVPIGKVVKYKRCSAFAFSTIPCQDAAEEGFHFCEKHKKTQDANDDGSEPLGLAIESDKLLEQARGDREEAYLLRVEEIRRQVNMVPRESGLQMRRRKSLRPLDPLATEGSGSLVDSLEDGTRALAEIERPALPSAKLVLEIVDLVEATEASEEFSQLLSHAKLLLRRRSSLGLPSSADIEKRTALMKLESILLRKLGQSRSLVVRKRPWIESETFPSKRFKSTSTVRHDVKG
ncbi:MAG: hypothetical protein KVP17_000003 [Porospora cf. gigantea B]|nr:MAG: hypothetical protein KVP17_000003 [Porospora cf. gigantea B]